MPQTPKRGRHRRTDEFWREAAFHLCGRVATPGSVEGLHLVVTDIVAARAQLAERGVEIGDVFHFEAGKQAPGPDPAHSDFNSFADFRDPDGNSWLLQEVRYGKGGT